MSLARNRNTIRIALGVAALIVLGISAIVFPPTAPWPGLPQIAIATLAAAFLTVYIIPLPSGEASIVHLVGLGLILAYNPPLIIAAVVVGVALGGFVRSNWQGAPSYRRLPAAEQVSRIASDVALHTFSLLFAYAGYSLAGGELPLSAEAAANVVPIAAFVVLHYTTSLGLLMFEMHLRGENLRRWMQANRGATTIVQLLPIPFAIVGAVLIREMGIVMYTLLTALVMVLAVAMHNFGQARIKAEQRLRELTLLNNISHAMRSSLDLDGLLEIIYYQVSTLLGVKNFYIALYEAPTDTISFPISVKGGKREQWTSRPATNRLTDHVIRNATSLFVPRDVPAAIERLGLQPGDNQPEAWLGVPITSKDQVVGCLAILSYIAGEAIAPDAEQLLGIVASQAGVAIDNARMFGEANYRASELATLAEVTTAMSASRDPDHVLELIAQSATRLFNCQKSAIFLPREDNHQILELTRAEGLSDAYSDTLRASPGVYNAAGRLLAISSGEPALVADIESAELPPRLLAAAHSEGIRAYAELPLLTQGDVIGTFTLYFTSPHYFQTAEIELLKTFASQVALAIANARLYAGIDRALTRHSKQLQALKAINRELTSTLDLKRLFEVVLDRAMDYTTATAGCLHVHDHEKNKLVAVALRGYPPEVAGVSETRSVSYIIASRVQRTGRTTLLADVRQDPDYFESTPNKNLSFLSVPIRHEYETLGVITLEASYEAVFTDDDTNFVTQLAAQAAIAIENARLFQTVTESRDRLQAVLNSTREGVLVVDSAGRIALANPRIEDLWQIKRAELIDHNLADLVRRPALGIPEKLGFTTGELLELLINLSQGLAATTPKHIYRLEGPAPHFFERSGTPVLDEHLRVIGWVIVLRDVTEEKQVEEVREELAGMIVHDLRSPMTSVLGSLRLIEDIFVPRDDTGMLKEAVDVSSRASRKMLMLIDSLLDISKEEAGAMTLEQKPLNIRSIADSIVNDMGPMASLQSIQLIDEMPADLPLLMIDRDKVERVFTNLIDNALKFTPEDGQIILRASLSNHVPDGVDAEDRYMLCEVLDSGPGIPEEYRERIFDRFAQVRGREGRRRGSGLGLAFCRMVVEAHGGKIWAQDRPEGGSVFKFTLPVVKEQN